MIKITDEELHALPPDIISLADFRERKQKKLDEEAQKNKRTWQFNAEKEVIEQTDLIDGEEWVGTYQIEGAEKIGRWLLKVAQHVRWKRRRAGLLQGWQELAAGRAPEYQQPLLEEIEAVRRMSRHGAGAVAKSLVDQYELPIGIAFGVACTWTGSHPSPKWESVRSAHLSAVEAQAMIAAHWKRLRERGLTPSGWPLSDKLKAAP